MISAPTMIATGTPSDSAHDPDDDADHESEQEQNAESLADRLRAWHRASQARCREHRGSQNEERPLLHAENHAVTRDLHRG
jgi:hypothetical protein